MKIVQTFVLESKAPVLFRSFSYYLLDRSVRQFGKFGGFIHLIRFLRSFCGSFHKRLGLLLGIDFILFRFAVNSVGFFVK